MKELIIEAASIECSEERREISGKIVPMGTGEVGHTNMAHQASPIKTTQPWQDTTQWEHQPIRRPKHKLPKRERRAHTHGLHPKP